MRWLIEQMERARHDRDHGREFLFLNLIIVALAVEVFAIVGGLAAFWKLFQ